MTDDHDGSATSTGGARPDGAALAPDSPGPERLRIPDFFLVGQPKSGTTALYEMLKRHPQVFIPDRKEPRYFSQELFERDPPRPGGTPKTLAEYATWFEGAGPQQRVGDTSPWSLWSHVAAGLIAEARPDARIIATLREPAGYLRSLHMQLVQIYVENETDMRRAIELEDRRREGLDVPRHTYWPQTLLYSEHIRYVEQLRRYHAVFPREQVLVLIYDDFRRDNEGTCREVMRFIGVDDSFEIPVLDANPTVKVRSGIANELVHAVSVGHGPVSRAVKAAIKAVTPGRWRRPALYAAKRRILWTEPDPPDEQLMLELRRRFKPEVEALSDYLERDLVALWGYDRLG